MKIVRLEDVTAFPEFRDMTPEELKEGYHLARAAFTAADLQKYTVIDEGVPAEQLLAELEEMVNQHEAQQESRPS